jgi:alpha-D-ribose 1-methylphosphonate 5-phosphate C-P lyase
MGYNFAFLDEQSKKELRRQMIKAVAIPGYQVPFASRELPVAQGWGTGGLQLTMAMIGPEDVLKVIDQGCDEVVNAVNIRRLLVQTTGVRTTEDTRKASIIQTRHRIPEEPLDDWQTLVFQVPYPEPLRRVEPSEIKTREMHAEADYSRLWVSLYEDIVRWGEITIGSQYPVLVNGRYVMDPSPIPRWDVPRLHMADNLSLFGAGREKRIYAVPPHTPVEPLEFDDHPFRVENFAGKRCAACGSNETYLDELINDQTGVRRYTCSDTSYCAKRYSALTGENPVGGMPFPDDE